MDFPLHAALSDEQKYVPCIIQTKDASIKNKKKQMRRKKTKQRFIVQLSGSWKSKNLFSVMVILLNPLFGKKKKTFEATKYLRKKAKNAPLFLTL